MIIFHSGFFFALFGKFPLIRIEEKSTLKTIIYGDIQFLFGTVRAITRTKDIMQSSIFDTFSGGNAFGVIMLYFFHLGYQIGYFN